MVKQTQDWETNETGKQVWRSRLESRAKANARVQAEPEHIVNDDSITIAKADSLGQPQWGSAGARFMAAVALVLMSIPLALTALIVVRDLGRPLMFRQARAGLDMRPFAIPKFRTMHDSRDASGELLPDHLRETKATRLLRRVRLDEIPQLLVILRGDMAFIGPRPLLPTAIEGFGELGRIRCTVRPGLTGWAQVCGNTRLTDAQKLALDIWYIDHRSRRLDVLIMLMTIVTIFRGEKIKPEHVATAVEHLAARGGTG